MNFEFALRTNDKGKDDKQKSRRFKVDRETGCHSIKPKLIQSNP